jgi:DNA-binding response OmpR family regulator/HD-like signal output (HDOD) protein
MMLTDQHILVVDDDNATRDSVRIMIDRLGYKVTAVEDAQTALSHLKEQQYDLLLSDLYMPGINGHGLVRAVRNQDATLPIVVMSGDGDMDDVIELLRTGINDFLQKPFRSGELMQTLRVAIENRKTSAKPTASEARNGSDPEANTPLSDRVDREEPQTQIDVRAILKQFRDDLRDENFSLPAPHPIGSQLMALQCQPGISIEPVVRMLEQSPNIARRVVAIANNSYYRGTRRVSNLREAAVRLGNRTVLSEAQAIVHRGFFNASNPIINEMMTALWERTSFQATFIRELYRLKRLGNPDDAFLATLFHNVGEVILLKYVDESLPEDIVLNESDIEHLYEVSHAQHEAVGSALLKFWKFPLSCQVLAGCHHQLTAKGGALQPGFAEKQLIHACTLANYISERFSVQPAFVPEDAITQDESTNALGLDDHIIDLIVQNVRTRESA